MKKQKQQMYRDRNWYFITFVCELPNDRPYCFSLFDDFFVLFRDRNDRLVCYLLSSLDDRNHRLEERSFEVMQKQGEIWFNYGEI